MSPNLKNRKITQSTLGNKVLSRLKYNGNWEKIAWEEHSKQRQHPGYYGENYQASESGESKRCKGKGNLPSHCTSLTVQMDQVSRIVLGIDRLIKK